MPERAQPSEPPGTSKDSLIVFVHIFKAAGTSVKAQLANHFGFERVRSINDGYENGRGFVDRLGDIAAARNVAAIAGHFQYSRIAPALSQVTDRQKRYFSVIRDPVDRLVSAYNYFRLNPDEKWHRESIQMDIEHFYRFMVENDPELCMDHQCRYLSEKGNPNFLAAIENIDRNFLFLTTVEGLRSQSGEAAATLGLALTDRVKLNSAARDVDLADLTASTFDFLCSITVEDRKLYEYIKWRRIPD